MEILIIMNYISNVLILFLLIYLFRNKAYNLFLTNKTENNIKNELVFDDSFSEYEKKLITKIHKKFQKYNTGLIPASIFYSILWQETGSEIYKDKKNEEIIGDDGNSVGYMQVNKNGALIEYNAREGKNYSYKDLKDEKINIEIGQKYLSYAIKRAKNIHKNKPYQWLTFKMYNGGLDETEESFNPKASEYANKAYEKFLKVKKFLSLNGIEK